MYFQNTAGIGANQYDEQFVVLFTLTMAQLKQVSLTYHMINYFNDCEMSSLGIGEVSNTGHTPQITVAGQQQHVYFSCKQTTKRIHKKYNYWFV